MVLVHLEMLCPALYARGIHPHARRAIRAEYSSRSAGCNWRPIQQLLLVKERQAFKACGHARLDRGRAAAAAVDSSQNEGRQNYRTRCRSCSILGLCFRRDTNRFNRPSGGRRAHSQGFREFYKLPPVRVRAIVGGGSCVGNLESAAWRTHLESELADVSESMFRKLGELIQLNCRIDFTVSTKWRKPHCDPKIAFTFSEGTPEPCPVLKPKPANPFSVTKSGDESSRDWFHFGRDALVPVQPVMAFLNAA